MTKSGHPERGHQFAVATWQALYPERIFWVNFAVHDVLLGALRHPVSSDGPSQNRASAASDSRSPFAETADSGEPDRPCAESRLRGLGDLGWYRPLGRARSATRPASTARGLGQRARTRPAAASAPSPVSAGGAGSALARHAGTRPAVCQLCAAGRSWTVATRGDVTLCQALSLAGFPKLAPMQCHRKPV